MSSRDNLARAIPWIACFVFACLLIPSTYWLAQTRIVHSVNQVQNIADHRQEASEEFSRSCRSKENANEIASCFEDAIANSLAPERTERVLKAQERIADWSLGVLVVSAFSLVVTAAGVIYVALTLRETRRATEVAHRSVGASESAVKATLEVGQAQVRAYLTISKARFGVEGNWFHFWATIVNSGQSPAFDIRIVAHISLVTRQAGEDGGMPLISRVLSEETVGTCGTTSAGGENKIALAWSHTEIGTELHDQVAEGGSFEIMGMLNWRDVFGGVNAITFSAIEGDSSEDLAFGEDGSFVRRGNLMIHNREKPV